MYLNFLIKLIILKQFIYCCLAQVTASNNFVGFGQSYGDLLFPLRADYMIQINTRKRFKFGNIKYSNFNLSSNGIISFNFYGSIFIHTYFPFPIVSLTAIAPFWSDIDISKYGNIFYRQIENGNDLQKIGLEIRLSLSSSFYPNWAFVVTWDEVAPFSSSLDSPKNTFQLVLTTNGSSSFVIFNYGQLNWETSYGRRFVAGINSGDGVNYLEISNSSISLMIKSNVNTKGKWIYRVDNFKSNILSTQTVTTTTKTSTATSKYIFSSRTTSATSEHYFSVTHMNPLNLILLIILIFFFSTVSFLTFLILKSKIKYVKLLALNSNQIPISTISQ